MQGENTTMKAFVLMGNGGVDQLKWRENYPIPQIGADDVLVKIAACGLNNTDINTRTGWYDDSVREATNSDGYTIDKTKEKDGEKDGWGGSAVNFPRIQGADVVGQVVDAGANVPPDMIGQRVLLDPWARNWTTRDWNVLIDSDKMRYFGSEYDGGFAEYCKTDHRQAHIITCDYSNEELATFPTAYATAENMLSRANVTSDDRVFITGASGGVGSALVQLAKLRGAYVVALCGQDKQDKVKTLNADAIVTRESPNLAHALKHASGYDDVNVVCDVVGGAQWMDYIDLLAREGRYSCSGAIAGPIVELDLRHFYLRNLTFVGATTTTPEIFTRLVGYINDQKIKPLLAASFPLRELPKAQKMFCAKQHLGNIIVTI